LLDDLRLQRKRDPWTEGCLRVIMSSASTYLRASYMEVWPYAVSPGKAEPPGIGNEIFSHCLILSPIDTGGADVVHAPLASRKVDHF
jgi:hypothetical protein